MAPTFHSKRKGHGTFKILNFAPFFSDHDEKDFGPKQL